jgi:thiazole tautomerase (transcriptional regulator TenI)
MNPVIHIISNGKQELATIERILLKIGSRIDYFHIREKHRTARELSLWVESLTSQGFPLRKLIINDRIDVAIAYGTGGVQLAYHSLVPSLTRHILLPGQKMGISVHSVEEAKKGEEAGADYLLFGHVFPTGSKPGLAPRGLESLQQVVESVSIPVIALGGITPENAGQVLSTGCAGIAMMSAVMSADDPLQVIQSIKKNFS